MNKRTIIYDGRAYSTKSFHSQIKTTTTNLVRYEAFNKWFNNKLTLKYKLAKLGLKVNFKNNIYEISKEEA